MWIHFCVLDNRGSMYRNFLALADHALRDLGHRVTIADSAILEAQALNLIMPPQIYGNNDAIRAILDHRLAYAVVGIERVTHIEASMPSLPDADRALYRSFVEGARGILFLFAEDAEPIRSLGGWPVALPYGFHPKVEEIALEDDPPVDVFFFGNMLYERRRRYLDAVIATGLRVAVRTEPGLYLARNSQIASAKVTLNLSHDRDTHVSPQRTVFLANNRIRCLSDRVADPDSYLESALVYDDPAALADACRSFVAARAWRQEGQVAYETARRRPMTRSFERALDLLRR